MRNRTVLLMFLLPVVMVMVTIMPAMAQQVTGDVGFAQRHHHHRRQTTSAARSEIRRGDQGEGLGVESLVAAARRAAEGRAQRAADHDGRLRLRRAEHVRRRRSDAGIGSHREERAALHAISIPRRSARRRARH